MEDVFEVQMDTVFFVRSPRMVFFFYLQRAEAVFLNKIDILYYIFQCLIQGRFNNSPSRNFPGSNKWGSFN